MSGVHITFRYCIKPIFSQTYTQYNYASHPPETIHFYLQKIDMSDLYVVHLVHTISLQKQTTSMI